MIAQRQSGSRRGPAGSKKPGWIGQYTLIMLAVQSIWLLFMLITGKTLLCHSDAYYQQYTTLRYTSEAVRGLLSGGGLRLVDFSLGQGLDALASLAFYGLTNPLYWIGALFTGRGLEVYYHFLVFLYRWLEGLTFGLYLRRSGLLKGRDWAVSAGGLFFAFCGYNTAGVLKCPYFAAGGICLCLMLLAVERFLSERKWAMVSLTAMLTLLVNFYHGYQTLLMTAAYALLRLLYNFRERGLRRTTGDALGLIGATLCGVMLSGFMLLPLLAAFLTSGRSGVPAGYTASLWRFPAGYYKQLFASFFAPYSQVEYWTQLNFLPWTAAGLFALFLTERSRRASWLRAGFLLALAGVCVPLVGKLFNGFNYVANRWSYGFAFVTCVCGTVGLAEMVEESFRRRAQAGGMLALWAVLMVVAALTGTEDAFITQSVRGIPMSAVVIAFGAALLICAAAYVLVCERRRRAGAFSKRRATRFIAVTTALSCLAFSAGYGILMITDSSFYRQGLDAQIAGSAAAKAEGLGDDGFARVDTGFSLDAHASLLGYYGTGYYWSIIPRTVSDYYVALQAPALRWFFQLGGLGGDPYLDAVAAVGGATRKAQGPDVLPYGFTGVDDGVYVNQYALPLGVFFDQSLSEQTYLGLSPLAKREALLSAAVLEDAADSFSPSDVGQSVPFSVEQTQGLSVTDAGMQGEEDGTAVLAYDAPADSLVWLWIREPRLISGGTATYLMVRGRGEDDARTAFYISNPDGNYYYAQQGLFVYLGQAKAGTQRLTLKLEKDGAFSFSDMQIVAAPAQRYVERAQALRQGAAFSGEVRTNAVEGRFCAPSQGVLQISIPWSEGWRATVNGQPAELVRCGGMYMGIPLEAGEYDIALVYSTPWLKEGVIVSLAGAALLALALVLRPGRRRGRR